MTLVATRDASRAVQLFHALSDETRLEILDHLKEGEQCVCDLTDALKSAQSRLSFHLKVLKEAGLIEDRREGRWIYYSVNREALRELEELVRSLKQAAKSGMSASRCC
jgi:ArsR family transcriptional regulator